METVMNLRRKEEFRIFELSMAICMSNFAFSPSNHTLAWDRKRGKIWGTREQNSEHANYE